MAADAKLCRTGRFDTDVVTRSAQRRHNPTMTSASIDQRALDAVALQSFRIIA